MQTRDQIMGEILALKELLRNSDYEIIKLAENMADCTTMAELKTCFQKFLAEFGELVQKRRAWRAQVDELQEQLDNLPDDEPEDMPEEAPEGENTAPDGVSGNEDAPEGGGEIDASDSATDGDSGDEEPPESTSEERPDTAPEEGNPTDE